MYKFYYFIFNTVLGVFRIALWIFPHDKKVFDFTRQIIFNFFVKPFI